MNRYLQNIILSFWPSRRQLLNVSLLIIYISFSFSTSYQLLRHFDLADVRGQVDALSYLEMTDLGIM